MSGKHTALTYSTYTVRHAVTLKWLPIERFSYEWETYSTDFSTARTQYDMMYIEMASHRAADFVWVENLQHWNCFPLFSCVSSNHNDYDHSKIRYGYSTTTNLPLIRIPNYMKCSGIYTDGETARKMTSRRWNYHLYHVWYHFLNHSAFKFYFSSFHEINILFIYMDACMIQLLCSLEPNKLSWKYIPYLRSAMSYLLWWYMVQSRS
jgi:hypothetical protein